jgi:hypothetical protein
MSNPDPRLTFRRMLQAVRAAAKDEATQAASGVVSDAENAALAAVDEHATQKQYVHGVGPLYVAKTRNDNQYVDWSEIQNKPSLDDLEIDPSGWEIDAAQITTGTVNINRLPVADAGEVNAFELVRANDPRLLQQQFDMTVGVTVQAGDWITVYNDGGTEKIKPADASDPTTAAIGFVAEAKGAGSTATVFPFGVNTLAYLPGVSMADVGSTVFLSTTAGKCSLTPPDTTGQVVQPLGQIVTVHSTTLASVLVRYEFRFTL